MTIAEAQAYVRDAPWPAHSASHEDAALYLADEIDRLNEQLARIKSYTGIDRFRRAP